MDFIITLELWKDHWSLESSNITPCKLISFLDINSIIEQNVNWPMQQTFCTFCLVQNKLQYYTKKIDKFYSYLWITIITFIVKFGHWQWQKSRPFETINPGPNVINFFSRKFIAKKYVNICGLSHNLQFLLTGLLSTVNYGKKSVVGNIGPWSHCTNNLQNDKRLSRF
jgi:hypothetical protein